MRGYLKNDTFFGLIALKSKILALNGWAADGVYRSADGGYNCWVSLCTKVKYCKHVLCTVHLVNLLGWIGKGDHSRYLATLLLKIRVN